jgi:hypothetical protein
MFFFSSPISTAAPTPPTIPPIRAALLLLDGWVVPVVNMAGSVGVTVTTAVDTMMVKSVPVPILDVYEVTLAEVIGVGVAVVFRDVVVVTLCGVLELFSFWGQGFNGVYSFRGLGRGKAYLVNDVVVVVTGVVVVVVISGVVVVVVVVGEGVGTLDDVVVVVVVGGLVGTVESLIGAVE